MINTPYNYTGSKFLLLDSLIDNFDYSKNIFVDLFTGGGSVFTNIIDKYDIVIINDIIKELVELHKQLIESDDIIIKTKNLCVDKNDKDEYLKLRKSFNDDKNPEKLWALMLSCTNNMLRFNRKFEFNQSFGYRTWNNNTDKKVNNFTQHIRKYKDKIIYLSDHFNNINIEKPSMVYMDPPYLESEAGYNSFYIEEYDEQLYEYCLNLNNNKSSFMISGILGEHKNGKRSKLIDKLISDGYNYKILDYNYEKVARNKNSKNSNEIIIMNYFV